MPLTEPGRVFLYSPHLPCPGEEFGIRDYHRCNDHSEESDIDTLPIYFS